VEEGRWLYNRVLEERTTAWEQRQESVRLSDQQALLPVLEAERPSLAGVQSQVWQHVAVRLDLAFQACFRRGKAGEAPGYPRFRGRTRYDRFTFPHVPVGCRLDVGATRLRVRHVGLGKLILHRPLEGTPKTAPIRRRRTGKWSVCCSGEGAEPSPLPTTGQHVGMDVGLKTVATLSTGQEVATPRCVRQEDKALARVHRAHSKLVKGTPERAKHRTVVARVHERLAWRRGDFSHQHSRRMVHQCDLLAVDDRSGKRMTHPHGLAKSLQDAAWSQFTTLLASTAAWAGRQCVAVTPASTRQGLRIKVYASRSTRQDGSGCGHRQALSLADRTAPCPCCGLVLDRDLNASLNMLRLGQHSLASAQKPPCFRRGRCHFISHVDVTRIQE
jgi:putative transposase